MDRIAWNDSFSVGVPKMDRQHQVIIDMVNVLLDNSDSDVDSEIISDTLTRMTEYAQEHFRNEEDYLLESGHPDIETHKAAHREFRKKTVALCMDTMKHQNTIPAETLEFLKNWWVTHILETDMQYNPTDRTIRLVE